MLRPNLAYNSTFNCVISSLIVLSFSSSAVTSSSILLVDVVNNSCTSGSGRLMKESPILYLPSVSYCEGKKNAMRTVFCRPHLPIPVHSRCHPGLLFLSIESSARRLSYRFSKLTCFAFNSSSRFNSRWCSLLNLLILSWSSLRTSTSSPPAAASSSLES
jgi:hypothetical protein